MAQKILFVAPTSWDKDYTMWFTRSSGTGSTSRIPFVRKNTLTSWVTGGDYDDTNEYDIEQLEKTEEFKKARVVKKRNSVARMVVAPIYENTADKDFPRGIDSMGRDKMSRYDIYDLDLENTMKPIGKMYIVHIQSRKYTNVHFFLTRKEASYWVKSMSENRIKLKEARNRGDVESRLFLGQFLEEKEAEVFLSEFVEDSPIKCVIHVKAHRYTFMTNKKMVYAEVITERGILIVKTEESTYSMPSRIIDKIFVDEYTLKIFCKDLSLEIIKVK